MGPLKEYGMSLLNGAQSERVPHTQVCAPREKKPRTAAGRRDMKTRNAGEEGMNEL